MSLRNALVSAGVCGLLAVVASADVWTVDDNGPAQFSVIQDAIDAAADGDVVLVQPGTYAGFAVTGKGVSVIGVPAPINPSLTSRITIESTSATQTVVLASLRCNAQNNGGLEVFTCAGPVRVQDCRFQGKENLNFSGAPGAQIFGSSNVVVSDTICKGGIGHIRVFSPPHTEWTYGGGHGAYVVSANAAFFGSTLAAGSPAVSMTDFYLDGKTGGSGLLLWSCFTFAGGCGLSGGKGGSYDSPHCSTTVGAGDAGDGGNALWVAHGASTFHSLANTFAAGDAGTGDCGWYLPGHAGKPVLREAPGSTLARVTGSPRTLAAPRLLTATSIANLTATGAPGDTVYFVTDSSAQFTYSAGMHGVWALTYPPAGAIALGVTDGTGTLSTSFALPPLQAGEAHRTTFVQSYHVDATGAVFAATPLTITLVP